MGRGYLDLLLNIDSKVPVGDIRAWLERKTDDLFDVGVRANGQESILDVLAAAEAAYVKRYAESNVKIECKVITASFEGREIDLVANPLLSRIFEDESPKKINLFMNFKLFPRCTIS